MTTARAPYISKERMVIHMDTVCANVQTAVCKSLQSMGLHPRKEHQIENAIAIIIRSSGPEYLLARLSDLNDWRKMHMRGDTSYHPEWHKYKHHCEHASQLIRLDPKYGVYQIRHSLPYWAH